MPKKKSDHTSKKVTKKDAVSQGHLRVDLTDAEKEVLSLLTAEFLTPKQVSRRRGTGISATRNIIASLRKKGVLSKVTYTPVTHTYTLKGTGHHPIRLHGERYRVKLLGPSQEYSKARERGNSILYDGNRVVLYRDSLMVFSYQSFEGRDVDECEHKASEYWFRFFQKLQDHLKVRLLKERSQNIKQVFFHFAECGNELASDLRRKKQKLRVFGSKDGKEWLLFDDSNNLDEAETTRPPTALRTARQDMSEVVQPFFNDLRDNSQDVLLPSQLARTLNQTAALVRENASTMSSILKLMEAQLPRDKAGLEPEKGRPDYFG